MASTRKVHVSTEIDVPQPMVWARVSDHEGTPGWVDAVKRVTLTQDGTPRNGVGAVRLVEFKPLLWTSIHERITRFEAPHAFDYVLFKGMPALVSHLGTVSVDDLGEGRSRLNWDVDFVFRTVHPFRLFLPQFLKQFEAVLTAGLAKVKAQSEGEAASQA